MSKPFHNLPIDYDSNRSGRTNAKLLGGKSIHALNEARIHIKFKIIILLSVDHI